MDDDENRKTDGETLKLKLKLKQVLTKLKASMLKNKEYQKEIEEFKAAKERASNGVSPGILSEYKDKLKEIENENVKLSNENTQFSWQLNDLRNKYSALKRESELSKNRNAELAEKEKINTGEIETLKGKLKVALLKLKSTKSELQESSFELESIKSKFADYKESTKKSLRVANEKVENIIVEKGSLELVRKELDETRAKCDNAIVDLKFAIEEKNNLRKELNERIKESKILHLKKDDTISKNKNKELRDEIDKLQLTIKKLEADSLANEKQYRHEIAKKSEAARQAVFDQETQLQKLQKKCSKLSDELNDERDIRNNLEKELKVFKKEHDDKEEANQKEARELDAIINLAKEQASRDSNMEAMKNTMESLNDEIKELKRVKNMQRERLILLEDEVKHRKAKEAKILEEAKSKIGREKDLVIAVPNAHAESSAGKMEVSNNTSIGVSPTGSSDQIYHETGRVGKLDNGDEANVRRATNVEYLKNCLLKFLLSETVAEQKQLLPVFATILHFTTDEKKHIKKAFVLRHQGVSGSLISFVSTLSGVDSRSNANKSSVSHQAPPTW